jgi:hypothetical protein
MSNSTANYFCTYNNTQITKNVTTETSYEQMNMKIQTFIYDLNSFLAVCYLGTLNSKTRKCGNFTNPIIDRSVTVFGH